MIINGKSLCSGCFSRLLPDCEACPICGYKDGADQLQDYLKQGTAIGNRYVCGNVISVSGEGIIYQGFDSLKNAKVVLKEYFPSNLAKRNSNNDNLLIESGCSIQYKALMSDYIDLARTLQKLNGLSCLVDILDIVELNNTAYVVLTNFEGITLEEYLLKSKKELKWEEAREIFVPLISSIRILHESNVIHRGICPKNIVINKNGEIKLIDFFISATRTDHSEIKSELIDGFAAPEQYRQNGWQGNWTDVYSLAATMYRSLTGMMPVTAVNRAEDDKQLSVSMINKDVPKYVSDAITNALSVSPKQRTKSADQLLYQLNKKEQQQTGGGESMDKQNVKGKWKLSPSLKYALISFAATTAILIIFLVITFNLIFGPSNITPSTSQSSGSSSLSSGSVTTPNFVGKTYATISSDAELKSKFNLNVTYEYSANVAIGIVISQNPAPNAPIDNGATVTLVVSKGPLKVKMPNVVGSTLDQAKKALDDLKILYQIVDLYEPGTPAGTIVRASKNVNDEIDIANDRVTLYVSTYSTSSAI